MHGTYLATHLIIFWLQTVILGFLGQLFHLFCYRRKPLFVRILDKGKIIHIKMHDEQAASEMEIVSATTLITGTNNP